MAKTSSKNGTIAIANGVREDCSDRLERVIDHMTSEPHMAATNKKKMDEAWEECTTSHPWLRALTAYNKTVFAMLLRMAVDVYNDCLIETVSARSWPMRSLACLASDHLLAAVRQNGADVEFVPFTPASSDLHYRDPNYYKQKLDVIYELEKVRLSQMFNRCTVLSVQIDGSCDKQMLDHKFVSGRMANSDGSVTSVFVVMHSPEKNGAPGLLEAVNKALDLTGGKDTKLVGVTTDGESANTGRHGGLWRLLADQVQRGLATFWCAVHRSDLAIESVVSTVPELGIWKSNLLGLVRFFRTP